MAQRTVCLYEGNYIGIETIFTIVNGKQINIPNKLADLREKSRRNQLFCPCGCGANLTLVAGDKNLREQHFRLKDSEFNKECIAVFETKTSIYSKIVLKCWLEDKIGDADIMSRVPINMIDDITRKYEFTFLSEIRKIALSYCYDRVGLSDEKIDILESNSQGIKVLYVLDNSNSGANGQYPESVMKVQKRQGYCLFLTIGDSDYFAAKLKVTFYAQDINKLWEEIIVTEDFLSNYTIDFNGNVMHSNREIQELVQSSKDKYSELQEAKRVQLEEKRRNEQIEKQRLDQEQRRNQELFEIRQAELLEKRRTEVDERRVEDSKTDEDYYSEILPFMNQQENPVYDSKKRRWIKCRWCEKIAMESKFCTYGGKDSVNLGTCYECKDKILLEDIQVNSTKAMDINKQINNNKCPECGGELVEKIGSYGKFMGCKGYPKCRYTRPIR